MNSFFAAIFRNSERRRTYTQLAQLDDHLLRDIGLTRGDLQRTIAARGKALRHNG